MYCFLLVVDDVAGNHRMARKFVLFDDVNKVEIVPDADKAMVVKSAAANTSFTWITDLNSPVRILLASLEIYFQMQPVK